jgi:hypothetical protein
VLASLSAAAWTLWERSRHDPWLRLLDMAVAHLKKAGVTVTPNSPPRSVAAQLARHTGATEPRAQALADWLLRLEAQRYAPPGKQHSRLATLRDELKHLIRFK